MTWYSKNSVAIFEKLTADESVIKCIEDYLISVTYKKRFDCKNVPQLVLIVMSLITDHNLNGHHNLKSDIELQELSVIQNVVIENKV